MSPSKISGAGIGDDSLGASGTLRFPQLSFLGWNERFERGLILDPARTPSRVAAVDRERFTLIDAGGSFRAVASGNLVHRLESSSEAPCVGDWVETTRPIGDAPGVVHGTLPRATVLRRKSAGVAADVQTIAANLDQVIVVQSCVGDFSVNRLERYLVMIGDGGAEARILLTKSDLVDPATADALVGEIRAAGIDAPVGLLSNLTREGMEALRASLSPGATHCFVGSSGVGKSTLVNALIGREAQRTASVDDVGLGRHTTVRRELIVLEGGALVIDTPGMREFGVIGAETGIREGFGDIADLAPHCRFRDCTHTTEPGCAVREAVETGRMRAERLENHARLRAESEFNEMSRLERRKKDRDFGRFIKATRKDRW